VPGTSGPAVATVKAGVDGGATGMETLLSSPRLHLPAALTGHHPRCAL
jgi:hypothetical protein